MHIQIHQVESNRDARMRRDEELLRDVSCYDYFDINRPGGIEMRLGTENLAIITDSAIAIDHNYCSLEEELITEGFQLIPLQSITNKTQFTCDECKYSAGSRYNLTRNKESLHNIKAVGTNHHNF